MDFTPYLNFNGTCAEAFKFYEQTFHGRVAASQTFGESPMKDQVPAEWRDKIVHARLEVGNQVVMGSDAPPSYYHKPQGMSVSITVKSYDEAHRIFNALSHGGNVTMPFAKTFWSPGFGITSDRYGIPWMIGCEQ